MNLINLGYFIIQTYFFVCILMLLWMSVCTTECFHVYLASEWRPKKVVEICYKYTTPTTMVGLVCSEWSSALSLVFLIFSINFTVSEGFLHLYFACVTSFSCFVCIFCLVLLHVCVVLFSLF